MKQSQTKEPTFTKAFQELEQLSQELEQGEIDLEESLNKYERGVYLASLCRKHLHNIENKVKVIQESLNKTNI